jgi:predicted HAD superfamily phosphohydrolase
MSSSDISHDENFEDFQALFSSLPKNTQRQLLSQVVAQTSVSNKALASSSENGTRSSIPTVKIHESIGNTKALKVLSIA